MANKTNEENWAARERLRAVEMMLWWRGWAGRADLVDRFGISPAQASSDFQKYLDLNGREISYQTSRKRYEASEGFSCHLHEASLEEAVREFLGAGGPGVTAQGGTAGSEKMAVLSLPKRSAPVGIARKVMVALLAGNRLRVRYHSLNAGEITWRWLRPGALAWDGRRWHVRAWCEKNGEWRDFVMGRIAEAEWPVAVVGETAVDADWNAWETLRFRINPELTQEAREALRVDYGLEGDVLELQVRRALKGYLLAEMFIDGQGHGTLPNHFVVDP